MKKVITILGTILILSGCSNNSFSDIDEWMKVEEKSVSKKIAPISEAKVFQPVTFIAQDDPFKEKVMTNIEAMEKNKFAPDINRRKEPLEKYSLDQLKITGMIIKDGKMFAIIKSPDGKNNYVTKGNYIGANYGQIVSIDEAQLKLEERVQDADEWKIKNSVVLFVQ